MENLSQHFPAPVLLMSGLTHSLPRARPKHCVAISSIPGLHPPDAKSTLHQPAVMTKNVSRCCQVSSGYRVTPE